jgi:hypothetical protein
MPTKSGPKKKPTKIQETDEHDHILICDLTAGNVRRGRHHKTQFSLTKMWLCHEKYQSLVRLFEKTWLTPRKEDKELLVPEAKDQTAQLITEDHNWCLN